MARLPQPGGDEGQWGDVLNNFLSVAHADNGAIKHGTVVEQSLAPSLRQKVNSSSSSGAVNVTSQSANYTASSGDFVIGNANGAGFTVTLPAPVNGARVAVKKIDASVNAIIVMRSGVQIDNEASVSINSRWQSQDFLADNNQWYRV